MTAAPIPAAYYNEIEPYPAQWLRNLATAGHIAPGVVDDRDIREVQPDDITGTQAHFFAGIGTWSYALRLAGWPDNQPVWTGSCPCQPFSTAGKRGGTNDPRHLWPEWFRLIRECKPPVIFGEQVASKDGLAWLDLVYADLESAGYSIAAFDLCAAGAGAPHIRQRLYFVADTEGIEGGLPVPERRPQRENTHPIGRGETGNVADTNRGRCKQREKGGWGVSEPDESGIMGNSSEFGRNGLDGRRTSEKPANGHAWSDFEWLPCRDGKVRPTQPGLFPLVNGAPARVGRLRAYGNAIVAPLAAEFIQAYMEVKYGN